MVAGQLSTPGYSVQINVSNPFGTPSLSSSSSPFATGSSGLVGSDGGVEVYSTISGIPSLSVSVSGLIPVSGTVPVHVGIVG